MTTTAKHCDSGKRLDTIEREQSITRQSVHDAKEGSNIATREIGLVKKDIESLISYDHTVGKTMQKITDKLDTISNSQIRFESAFKIQMENLSKKVDDLTLISKEKVEWSRFKWIIGGVVVAFVLVAGVIWTSIEKLDNRLGQFERSPNQTE